MTLIEKDRSVPQAENSATSMAEQVEGIAQRFFDAIDDKTSCANAPVFVAYFMEEDENHRVVREQLLNGVVYLSADPKSTCQVVQVPLGVNGQTIILHSRYSNNVLLEQVQTYEDGTIYGRHYTIVPGSDFGITLVD